MDTAFAALASSAGILAFFGCIAFATWVDYRKKKEDRDTTHAERMRALELGVVLPDAEVAWAAADRSRARGAGAIGVLVPLLSAVGAVVATAVLTTLGPKDESPLPFGNFGTPWHARVLLVLWPVWGLVSLVTVVLSLVALRRRGIPRGGDADRPTSAGPRKTEPAAVLASFAERPAAG